MEADRKALLAAVRDAARAVSTRPGIPALTGLLLEASDGMLSITGTDLEITIRSMVPAKGDLKALVPAKLLVDVLRRSKDKRVSIESDGAQAKIGPVTVRTLATEDFPATQPFESKTHAVIEAAEFAKVAGAVAPFASPDMARPILNGMLYEQSDAEVRVTATDSYRLATGVFRGTAHKGDTKTLVPERAVSIALKILGKKPSGPILIGIEETRAVIGLSDKCVTISTRLVDGEFPNYKQLIPEASEYVLTYGPELLEAITEASTMAQASSPVRLTLNGGVSVKASTPDLGEFATFVPAEWSGEDDLVVAYNPTYLTSCINASDGAPMGIRDGLKPATFEGEQVTTLIMPVRLPAPVG